MKGQEYDTASDKIEKMHGNKIDPQKNQREKGRQPNLRLYKESSPAKGLSRLFHFD